MRVTTQSLKALTHKLLTVLVGSALVFAPAMGISASASVPAEERLVAGSSTGLAGTLHDFGSQGWFSSYGPGVKYYSVTAEVGAALALTYHVTDTSGNAAASTAVTLKVGKAWSASNATFSSSYVGHTSITTTGSAGGDWNGWNPSNGAEIGGTTDSSGNVTFNLTNTNSSGEPRPSDLNAADVLNSGNGGVFAQFALIINGNAESADNQDIVDIHFVAPAVAPGLPSIRLVPQPITSGGSANANDYTSDIAAYYSAGSKSYQQYLSHADSRVLTFQVTTNGTTPAPAGQTVKLFSNSPYSGSNANWTVNGTPASAYSAFDGGYGALVSATTDINGQVSFTIVNTDSTGFESVPSSPTQPRPGSGRLYGTFKPVLFVAGTPTSDTAEDTDLITLDVYAAVAPGLPSIRLIPQPITGTDANDYTGDISAYYSAGSKSYQQYFNHADSRVLTYQVTTNGTTPAPAGQTVKLYSNSAYSGSNASWTVNGTTVGPHSAFDGGYGAVVSATTNVSGQVSFTIVNTDSAGFETAPTSATQARPGSGRLYGTFKPVLFLSGSDISDTAEDTDLISFDVYSNVGGGSGATHANPDKATLTLVNWGDTGFKGSGPIDDSIRGREWFLSQYYSSEDHWYYSYADAGATVRLTWHVTNSAGTPLASTTVRLNTNFAPGTPNATWTGAGIAGGVMTGTTDSSGNVTFTITNTNANPSGAAPADITSNDTALSYENNHTYPWVRMALIIPGHTISADPNTTVDQTTDLVDILVIPTGSIEAIAAERAAAEAAANAAQAAKNAKAVKVSAGDKASIVVDINAKTITCSAPSVTGTPTMAAYYLYINHNLIAGQRIGSFYVNPLHPEVDAVLGDATLSSATWAIAPSWNDGHVSTANCDVQIGNSNGTSSSRSAAATIARVGKYVAGSKKSVKTASAVTMRLVSPVLTKDASGAPVDYVDESSSPVQDHWSQYYGNANGGLGVFYKYFNAGSIINIKYHVTDSVSGKALSYFNVWLVVNKNYGGVEAATFSYQRNGITYNVAPHSTDMGETQIPGITDINGDVSFTLVNTNSASSAEPKPSALNKIQPSSVTPVFSTITLMAHLNPGSETKETKDFIWAHIVKP